MQAQDIERIARRRASVKLGWWIHASVFVVVNAFLAVVSGLGGHHWAVYPAFGWGVGLMMHALVVYVFTGGGGLRERMVERERARLAGARDPW